MKIGIHQTKSSFSDCWIAYCEARQIAWKPVNCYRSDLIKQLADCDALMWHFNHASSKDCLFAKQLLYSVKASGKQVFPDFNTAWHFNDKIGQKYLLEAVGAPLIPSHVFYSRSDALEWIRAAVFPKVFKLRSGASSQNVKLVRNKTEAIRLTNRAFGRGFSQYDAWESLKERFRKLKEGKTDAWDVIKGIIRLGYSTKFSKITGKERGYAYFQDFIPNNDYDIRVIVIDRKAFAVKRLVRENDFRASGSGFIKYEKENFDNETIRLSFKLAEKLKTQCVAFDFVYKGTKPLVTEISYGFTPAGYDSCPGYWDKDLNWHEGKFNPYGWMVDLIVKNVEADG